VDQVGSLTRLLERVVDLVNHSNRPNRCSQSYVETSVKVLTSSQRSQENPSFQKCGSADYADYTDSKPEADESLPIRSLLDLRFA
jgi:hypothetical protein